jgi:arginine/lysine/ornithine decarboxylase
LSPDGIPAALLTAYLDTRGIEVEKTTDFTVLFLFSIGVTKGKWGTLVHAFLDFKADYDANVPLERAMPEIVSAAPSRYRGLGVKDLAREMMATLIETQQARWLADAFGRLPEQVATPAAAYRALVQNRIEAVPLAGAAERVAATGIVPYPPGIPMVMPGERLGEADGPYLAYLRALETWDRRFPGFGHDTHGVDVRDGTYWVRCL